MVITVPNFLVLLALLPVTGTAVVLFLALAAFLLLRRKRA